MGEMREGTFTTDFYGKVAQNLERVLLPHCQWKAVNCKNYK